MRQEHPDWPNTKIAAALGTSERSVRRALAAGQGAPQTAAAKEPDGRTLADFRREHDQAWKIRDGIKRLLRGDRYMTDAEFRDAVRGNTARWRAAADAQEFRANRYRVGGELLWASEDTIREMRRIRGEAI